MARQDPMDVGEPRRQRNVIGTAGIKTGGNQPAVRQAAPAKTAKTMTTGGPLPSQRQAIKKLNGLSVRPQKKVKKVVY
jgi:hypothetical protein